MSLNKFLRTRTLSVDTSGDEREPLLSTSRRRSPSLGPNGIDHEQVYKKLDFQLYDKSDFIIKEAQPRRATNSSLVTIFTVWNTMVGTSLLAMPWGMWESGPLLGTLLCLVMASVCLYTAYLNVSIYSKNGKPGEGAELFVLIKDLIGPWAEIIAKLFSVLVLAGAAIIYWILLSNFFYHNVYFIFYYLRNDSNMQPTWSTTVLCPNHENFTSAESRAEEAHDTFNSIWNLHRTVPLYLILILFPVLNFKSPTFFTKFTSLGTMAVMYIMFFALVKFFVFGVNVSHDPESEYYTSFAHWTTFPKMSGMLTLSLFIHNIIINLMKCNEKQENNKRDLSIAYILVCTTYAFVGLVIYVSFPAAKSCIQDNILNNFLTGDFMTLFARFFLFFQLITVYPLILFMLRNQVLTMIFQSNYPSVSSVVGFNAVIVSLCVFFAIVFPQIGHIIRFTGAIAGFIHVYSMPCLLKIMSEKADGSLTTTSMIIHVAIPILGFINIIAQFIV
ncbi:sodium-coupled neutral amino acid transporter 9 homolog isoform X2 [Nilaparvata lugens]|uniref:sodium-coupled neutral amino acid transporter 9 homolog isoform X2 n=1 Tax=Nilaparvata lugens TaxID=108931 RepID=UPI00193E30CA|nr:sodium-coupled neutral amino acid transporter 9 homolog isoform X2 [Nilaparvata lugens]